VVALIVGIVFIVFAVYSVLPIPGWGLNWWDEVLLFLQGGVPIIAVFIGLIAVFIGIADIKDKIEAKKEEEEEDLDLDEDEEETEEEETSKED
jgi:flagellar biosynthesis/type III secretory pathway M-ring protein FliF/YscJ